VLNDVRRLGESKGLIEIRGAAEDKTIWSGGAGVNPFGHESSGRHGVATFKRAPPPRFLEPGD
jgi:hypothetical protein